MSQHDMNIANQGFAAFRTDLNNALAALASLSAGTSAPSSPTTHQFWLDTTATPYLLKYYDGTDWLVVARFNATLNTVDSQTLIRPSSFISGLALSNAADTDHDITVAVGAAVDSAGSYLMALTSAMTKQIDAAWAAGNNAGGLFSGAVGNSTWYHVFLIRKDTDGSIDAGFDTSITAANKPAGYSNYRRIGSVFTNGSANINQFRQNGNYIYWLTPTSEIAGAATSATWTLLTLTVPTGVVVSAFGTFQNGGGSASQAGHLSFKTPDGTDTTPANDVGGSFNSAQSGSSSEEAGAWGPIMTDTSARIRYYAAAASPVLYVRTRGWYDPFI